MATKPTNLPRWATDAGRTLEPTSGEKDTGWQAGYMPPARKMNWLHNAVYEYLQYMDAMIVALLLRDQVDISAGAGGDSLFCIAYDGSSILVVAGATGTIFYSTDHALTWTNADKGGDDYKGCVFAESLFVLCHDNEGIETSPDGSAWTTRTTPAGTYALMDVAHGAGSFVAVGGVTAGVLSEIIVSSDGITWTEELSVSDELLLAVVHCTELSLWVATGEGGTIYTASDPIGTWTSRTSGTAEDLSGVAWDGATAVAVGDNGTIIKSTDGTSWSAASSIPATITGQLRRVRWLPELKVFVAVGSNAIAYSHDGDVWHDAQPGLARSQYDVTYAGGSVTISGANEDVHRSLHVPE
jgi:hypothetical protein